VTAHQKRKYRELVLHVARETGGDPRCGSTKLNKVLFYADFQAFKILGASISGDEYVKQSYGPVPRSAGRVIRELEEAGDCVWKIEEYFGYSQKRLEAIRAPELSLFSRAELDLIRDVILELWDHNATEVSDLSHKFIGWRAAELYEVIPYGTVFVGSSPAPLSDQELAIAEDAIREFLAVTESEADHRPSTQV
jgi:hypothetical protein